MKTLIGINPARMALKRLGLACRPSVGLFALIALNASASPITNVVNGSFEETMAPGDWVLAASWTGLPEAYSLPTGMESIPATDGTRFLRLQTEDSGYIARVAQNLKTMVAGQT